MRRARGTASGRPLKLSTQILLQAICLFLAFTVLYPILWVVAKSVDPSTLNRPTSLIPEGATLDERMARLVALREGVARVLVGAVDRAGNGYRDYGDQEVAVLQFVRRTRDLGFSLDEIRHLLDLANQKFRSCRRVHDIGLTHLTEVRAKIRDLRRMEGILATMVKACANGTMPTCPLLEALASA